MTDSNKQSRVLINVLGIPLLLSAIYFGGIYFQCLIFIAIFISTLELKSMCLKKDIEIQIIPMFLLYSYLFLTHFLESISINIEILIFWVALILSLEIFRKKDKPIENIAITIFGMIWIGLFMNCIVNIRNIEELGGLLTLFMFLSVWICDSAAFFFGSKFGKTKILPNISPNKTWVGAISGTASVFVFCMVIIGIFYLFMAFVGASFITEGNFMINAFFLFLFPLTPFIILYSIFFTIIFGVISQIGDFVESMIKRQFGVKDSGTTLRGHGGFLDRMDSLILVAPTFYFLLYIMGKIG